MMRLKIYCGEQHRKNETGTQLREHGILAPGARDCTPGAELPDCRRATPGRSFGGSPAAPAGVLRELNCRRSWQLRRGELCGSPAAQLPEYNPFLLHVAVHGLQRVKARKLQESANGNNPFSSMLWFSLTAHWSIGSSSSASMLQTPETAHSEGADTEGNSERHLLQWQAAGAAEQRCREKHGEQFHAAVPRGVRPQTSVPRARSSTDAPGPREHLLLQRSYSGHSKFIRYGDVAL
ncbi:unnamed protein product [Boreogadus saida]